MLTQDQRKTFRLALAAWNCPSAELEELELDKYAILTDDEIVETQDTVSDFFDEHGYRNDRNGNKTATPRELNKTIYGDVYIWDDVQAGKGTRRGTLFVMDFETARAAYFDGEK